MIKAAVIATVTLGVANGFPTVEVPAGPKFNVTVGKTTIEINPSEYTSEGPGSAVCPGSLAPVHGHCDFAQTFANSCSEVSEEILARVAGEDGWYDPHNRGTYTKLGSDEQGIQLKRRTGNGIFTDHMNFGFEATADGGCLVRQCSDSDGISAPDGQTGFCNLADLVCNSQQGCQVVKNDLTLSGQVQFGYCPNANLNKCLVAYEAPQVSAEAKMLFPVQNIAGCPGSPAAPNREMCHESVTFGSDCATVQKEVEDRINGADGWTDPKSNPGMYVMLESAAGSHTVATRTTGNKKYTDKFMISYETVGSGCTLSACSESQDRSNNDESTNYCNMRNLYCGTKDGCSYVTSDFNMYQENHNQQGGCRRHDANKCRR